MTHFFSVHNDYPEGCRPKQGQKFAVRTADELDLVAYTNFCWEVNIPKTKKMLQPEIVHHLKMEGIENKFKNGEPGGVLILASYM